MIVSKPTIIAAAVALIAVILLSASWWQVAGARADLAAARGQDAATRRDIGLVLAARANTSAVALGRRPDADLIARIQRALTDAGLPVSACSGVQPRPEQQRGDHIMVQTVQLRLQGLRPGDFSAWTQAWYQQEQPWRITELQASHIQAGSGANSDGARYDFTLALAAPYLDDR